MRAETQYKLDYLAETKALMKSALIEKGQTVADNDTFRSYADKIRSIQGGTTTEKDIFPKDTVAFSIYPSLGGLYCAVLSGVSFTKGETYYVEWDGTIYTCVAKEGIMPTTGETGVGIGNFALAGAGADTGEPFACAGVLMATSSTDSTHTVRIYQKVSGASADDRVKYVTYMDRGAELIKYPVIEGDTARDPVIKGYIEKPTKEPTVSTVYTQSGWSKTDGGVPDSTALQNVTEDRTVYAAFTTSLRKYTVNFYDGDTLVHTEQVGYGRSSSYVYAKEDIIFGGWSPEPTNITGDMDCYAQWIEGVGALENTSWDTISKISALGQASNYWAVGDTKSVAVNGTVGPISVNSIYYVYIIGFDHNSELEGTGIHFGTFKTADGKDVALFEAEDLSTNGEKHFNINHAGSYSHGGWAGCDLRYDILGSTDVPPTGYNTMPVEGRTGYDATETCATNPVENTLMAALPTELRVVMKPMIKYSNNVGKTQAESAITAKIDYLPLLAQFEIAGTTITQGAAPREANKQKQYAYYASGNSPTKYRHSKITTVGEYWLRSPSYYKDTWWVTYGSGHHTQEVKWYYCLAPIFKV